MRHKVETGFPAHASDRDFHLADKQVRCDPDAEGPGHVGDGQGDAGDQQRYEVFFVALETSDQGAELQPREHQENPQHRIRDHGDQAHLEGEEQGPHDEEDHPERDEQALHLSGSHLVRGLEHEEPGAGHPGDRGESVGNGRKERPFRRAGRKPQANGLPRGDQGRAKADRTSDQGPVAAARFLPKAVELPPWTPNLDSVGPQIPGKVLSQGEIKNRIDVVALNFSEKAKEKLLNAGCKVSTIAEEIKLNPDAKNLEIVSK